jgi:hypothetical protein
MGIGFAEGERFTDLFRQIELRNLCRPPGVRRLGR